MQVMTPTEDLLSFAKPAALVDPEPQRSLMPAYGPDRLNDTDLTDVVRYLRTLRGQTP